MSRCGEYALMTGDASVYAQVGESDADSVPVPVPIPDKALAVSDHVLVGLSGCVAIAAEFRSTILGKVRPGDDFDVCHRAAIEAVAELRANDRPGDLYEIPDERLAAAGATTGWVQRRGSIDRDFGLIMVGFRRDGTTAMVQCGHYYGEREVQFGEPYTDPSLFEFTTTVPFGLSPDDVTPFYDRYLGVGAPTAAQAFRHALDAHRTLHESRPERVTAHADGVVLRWLGPDVTPARVEFACDVTDAERVDELYDAVLFAGIAE
jgi:hypothetical protein